MVSVMSDVATVVVKSLMSMLKLFSRREVYRRVLTAGFDESLGLLTCDGALCLQFGQRADRPVDRRRKSLVPSAARSVSKVAWTETEGHEQEHHASCDEACDDKMLS